MQLGLPRPDPAVVTATSFRLLAVALAALAYALEGRQPGAQVVLIGAGYVVAGGGLWLLAHRLDPSWLAYPAAIIDVLAVTALLGLESSLAPLIWPLYLFPLACAATMGRRPLFVAAALGLAGYLGTVWLTSGGVSSLDAWPALLLAATAFVIATLADRWRLEVQRRRAWQEVMAAARDLLGDGDLSGLAIRAARCAQRLVRADWAGLWWYEAEARLRPGAQVGSPPLQSLLSGGVPDDLARRLERGPVPLAELAGHAQDVAGEVLALRQGGAPLALLAVRWEVPPRDRSARVERLRLLAPWAADALVRARDRADTQERLRREEVLRAAATDLAGTLERRVVEGLVVRAVRSGLGASAALVERQSGQLIAGDPELVDALVRLSLDESPPTTDAGAPTAAALPRESLLTHQVGTALALLAHRPERPLDNTDEAWLAAVAALAEAALERCAAHERLQLERGRLQAGLEALPAPLALQDESGRLVLANAQYRALGLESSPTHELPTSGLAEREVTFGDPPRTFVVLTTAVGDTPYAVSLYREITREREALRAKDELIAMIGHELRNPLASIHGYSQIMTRQLGIMQQQLDQLNSFIGDFMDASRLEGGQLPLSREPVDLAKLARAAAERFRGAHQGHTLRLELAEAPPVDGDPARLGQVLDNLLTNAAKYSPEGTEVALALRAGDDEVVVSVRDQGVGLAPEHLPHVFDRFYRVPSTEAEQIKGLGLGLSIVRDLVEAHGGRIWAESAGPGQGSSFCIALPVSREVGAPQNQPAAVGA